MTNRCAALSAAHRLTTGSKSRQNSSEFCRLFIHCESNGISSRFSVYIIAEGVSHQPQAVFSFAMMICKAYALVIYNFCEIDDIHGFAVILRQEFNSKRKIAKIFFFGVGVRPRTAAASAGALRFRTKRKRI